MGNNWLSRNSSSSRGDTNRVFKPLNCILNDIEKLAGVSFGKRPMINASLRLSTTYERSSLRFYRHFNRLLDRQVVPYAVNESMIVDFRNDLRRSGSPDAECYWLLLARLAELALLCAGHYADSGEIGAAGDLLLNPRRIEVHLRGVDQPVVKERHRRLSEQLNPGGLSLPEFARWFRCNAVTHIVEPALLPDFAEQLTQSGWLVETFLTAFQDRMSQVAETMRFISTSVASMPAGSPSHRCWFDDTCYRDLGREVERTCGDIAYCSPYLTAPWTRDAGADARFKGTPEDSMARISL